MAIIEDVRGTIDLSEHGLSPSGRVFARPTTALLYMHALQRGDGQLAEGGPIVVDTGTARNAEALLATLAPSHHLRMRTFYSVEEIVQRWGELVQALTRR